MRRLARRLLRLGLAVFLGTLVAAVAASGWMRLTRLGPDSLAEPVDAAIVLGGRVAPDGHLGLDTHRRTNEALTLLASGRAGTLIFAGGVPGDRSRSDAEAMRAYAIMRGADAARLLIEPRSVSTFENLRFAFRIAEERGLDRLALVSDPYHLARAWALAAWLGRPDVALVAARGFEGDWWPHRIVTFSREALAWWYNLAKIAAWEGMARLGLSQEARAQWVR